MSHIFYLLTHIAETIIPMFEWMGAWSYVLLFILIFMETGLVIFPWLPGESLVFLTCSFIAFNPILKMEIVIPIFFFAALIGDTVNYYIGHSLSHWQWLKKRMAGPRFEKAQEFLARHGIKAVALGRFVPLIRTFVPLIAGTTYMVNQQPNISKNEMKVQRLFRKEVQSSDWKRGTSKDEDIVLSLWQHKAVHKRTDDD